MVESLPNSPSGQEQVPDSSAQEHVSDSGPKTPEKLIDDSKQIVIPINSEEQKTPSTTASAGKTTDTKSGTGGTSGAFSST